LVGGLEDKDGSGEVVGFPVGLLTGSTLGVPDTDTGGLEESLQELQHFKGISSYRQYFAILLFLLKAFIVIQLLDS
jgi:hypothetical protein